MKIILFLLLANLLIVPANLHAKKIPAAFLYANTLFFSPNDDADQDEVIFELKTEKIKSIATWELKFQDSGGVVRKTISGTKEIPEILVWDGLDDFGAPSAEGAYDVSFSVWNEKSQTFSAPPLRVVLDLTPPTISLGASALTIGMKDQMITPTTLYFSAVDLSGISQWKLELLDKNRQPLFAESSSEPLPSGWLLKGRLPAGKIVAVLSVTDLAANKGSSPPLDLEISPNTASAYKEPKKNLEQNTQPSEKKLSGPFLQLTSIASLSDLFGKDADNQSTLSPQATALLEPLANAMLESPGARAIILGHVEDKGDATESKALSSAFAWKVFSYFVKQKGCDKNSISVKGLGADVPIADNSTLPGRARNRRIEIQIFFPTNPEE